MADLPFSAWADASGGSRPLPPDRARLRAVTDTDVDRIGGA
ncbi:MULTISPECIES: hypothetical protein [Cryobacterium]|nr:MULTISPECIES: hypothetical protein [Cryobacterium]